MVNQNFINLTSLKGLVSYDVTKKAKNIDGSDVTLKYDARIDLDRFSYNKQTYYSMINGNSAILTFGLGSGTKEPSIDDFSLESVFGDDVFAVETFNHTIDNLYKLRYIFTITYKYTGADTITISEVGMFTKLAKDDNNLTIVMLAREVLETPITVSNGDVFTVTMVLS